MPDESPAIVASETALEASADGEARSARTLRARVLSGSMIMLVSSGFVGAMNLLYNLAVAHTLGADKFGHASAVYTVLMLLSSVTLSFQLLCSKFVAKNDSAAEQIGIYRFLHRRAWIYGIGVSGLLFLSSGPISGYLNLPTRNYIIMLAVATLFYVPLGVRRGLMQGRYDFRPLAFNFVTEVLVKLGGAVILMFAGFGVPGVVAAIVASVIVAYLFASPRREHAVYSGALLPAAMGEGIQASVFFVGQVIINNLDIILVKHFFSATQAGVYAAVALVGRVVYMLSWSVVSGMFPFSAGVRSEERDGRAVLGPALLLVVLISSLFTLGIWAAPPRLWHAVLGAGFPLGGHSTYTSLLVLYAATTGIYSLSVVLMSYEISRKIGNVSWLQLGFSVAIVAGIYLFHQSLYSVISVQFVLMTALLAVVAIPFLRTQFAIQVLPEREVLVQFGVHRVHRVREAEAIAEFLKNEFYQPEFDPYREPFHDVVANPDFENESDNILRRALLYRRRGRLWRELPPDTEWWEITLDTDDLRRIRVFPRSQWRRHADDSYQLLDTAERIAGRIQSRSSNAFLAKLHSMSTDFADAPEHSAVLLIGIDERSPLTIIEGNHRMTAATLVSPEQVPRQFRFLCGFSPRMAECCWYQTDLSTLWHYAKNSVAYVFEDRHGIINEALRSRRSGHSARTKTTRSV
jgi:O-antigen/teichoic acid export membrane protein